jgi:hypothetical protein
LAVENLTKKQDVRKGLVAGDMVATEEGIAGERLEVTDEGVVYEAGAATEDEAAVVGLVAEEVEEEEPEAEGKE